MLYLCYLCRFKPLRDHLRGFLIAAWAGDKIAEFSFPEISFHFSLRPWFFFVSPAYAGKSPARFSSPRRCRDHPRVCGEKFVQFPLFLLPSRITPACAGKSLKRSRSTVPPVAIVPLFPSVCNKPVVSDGSPAGRDAPLFLPAENAVPASPAYNLRSL